MPCLFKWWYCDSPVLQPPLNLVLSFLLFIHLTRYAQWALSFPRLAHRPVNQVGETSKLSCHLARLWLCLELRAGSENAGGKSSRIAKTPFTYFPKEMIRFWYGKKGRKHHSVKNKYNLVILLNALFCFHFDYGTMRKTGISGFYHKMNCIFRSLVSSEAIIMIRAA